MNTYSNYIQYAFTWEFDKSYDLNEIIRVKCNEDVMNDISIDFPILCITNNSMNDKQSPCNIKVNTIPYSGDEDIRISALEFISSAKRMEIFGSKLEYITTETGIYDDEMSNELSYNVFSIKHSFMMPCPEMMINLVSSYEKNVVQIHKFILTVVKQPKVLDFNPSILSNLFTQICKIQSPIFSKSQPIDPKLTLLNGGINPQMGDLVDKFDSQEIIKSCFSGNENNLDQDAKSSVEVSVLPKCEFCQNNISFKELENVIMSKVSDLIQESEKRILEEMKSSEMRILAKLNSFHF